MQTGYEYNDEVYFQTEGGHPSKIFKTREKAQQAADQKNMAEFKTIIKDGSIRDYGYNLDEVLDNKNATNFELNDPKGIFMRVFGKSADKWWKDYNYRGFLMEPSEKDMKRLMDCFNVEFYHVVEVSEG